MDQKNQKKRGNEYKNEKLSSMEQIIHKKGGRIEKHKFSQ